MNIFHRNYFVFMVLVLICGLYSVNLGLESTTELKLYHYWNAYSLLTGRFFNDVAPCGIQSFFNPIFDCQFYLSSKILNNYPDLFLFLQGIWAALGLFAIYKIINLIIIGKNINKFFLIVFSLLITATSYLFYYEIGSSLTDIQICFLSLWGTYFILKEVFKEKISPQVIFLSGILLGAAAGIKLTMCIYALSMFIVLLLYNKKFQSPLKVLFLYCIGCLFGILLTGGFWFYFLWKTFENPIFPLYNNVFHSDYTIPSAFHFDRGIPQTIAQWVAYPFYFENPEHSFVALLPFRDYRWPIIYVICIGYIIVRLIKPVLKTERFEKFAEFIDINRLNFLHTFLIISYLVWISMFAQIRHAAFIDCFSGFIVVTCLYFICCFIKIEKLYIVLLVFSLIFFQKTTMPMKLRVSPTTKLIEVQDMKIPDNSVVFTAGMPSIYAGAFQNPKCHYIYAYTDYNYRFEYSEKSKAIAYEMINNAKGNLYALWGIDGHFDNPQIWSGKIKYKLDKDSCKIIYNNLEEITGLCKVIPKVE